MGIAFKADQTLVMFLLEDYHMLFAVRRKFEGFETFVAQANGFIVYWELNT